eukprot:TRINITY_DN29554_c0_g1_i1.p1 TRINITY_DN29554_c0_g1~~TRINITY_DN29554_c0_g1_i1.p1  ORF type:complete len:599 (-),score=103.97 TRINITY_DN29554_c0_g1_i1:399-2195(-)
MNVCVIGAGSFGSAISCIAAAGVKASPSKFAASVRLWARRWELCREINEKHTNSQYFPGALPQNVSASADISECAKNCDVCILAVPPDFLDGILRELKPVLNASCIIVSLIKSLKVEDGCVVPYTRYLGTVFPGHAVAALMGPNLYKEMARGEFAEATLGCADVGARELLAKLFTTDTFAVNCVSDVEGVDLCGCMKNTFTLTCGFGAGLGWGGNIKAAIIRKGLLEIASFLDDFLPKERQGAMGTRELILEACGVGDLILSCTVGRGQQLANDWVQHRGNKSWQELENETMGGMRLPDMQNVQKAYSVLMACDKVSSYPLLAQTYHIAFAGADPASLVDALKGRTPTCQQPSFELSFAGQTALVTGAGNGIGRRIAVRLAELGAKVWAMDRDEGALKALKQAEPLCIPVCGDLGDLDALKHVVAKVGSVDLLVNAGGILKLQQFGEQDAGVWDATMDINARACWFLIQECSKSMALQRKGAIVNISSQSSSVAVSDKHLIYSTSKAAVDHITRMSAYALAKSNVRVNAVNPTVVRTELAIKGHGEEGLKKMAEKVPLGRICEPDDVADTVLYLLSDRARMITGVTLPVDGGFVISRL